MAIDWSRAARLLAEGVPPHDVAAAVGCSRSQLRRRKGSCSLFRALLAQYSAELVGAGGASESLQRPIEETVRARLEEEIVQGNTKVALWLAERLRLFVPEPGEGTDDAMGRLFDSMSDREREAFSRPD